MAGDINYPSVSALIPLTGTNNSTTFTDTSINAKVVTAFNNAKISTAINDPFGANVGNAYFDGTGDYATIANSTDFELGTGNFTLELWYYKTANAVNGTYTRLFQFSLGDTYSAVSLTDAGAAGQLACSCSSTGTSWNVFTVDNIASLSLNIWYHIALVRNGTNFTIYVNGTGTSLATSSASLYYASSLVPSFGGQTGTNRTITGYISNIRITKGIARYTSNFTSPTEAFRAYSGQIIASIIENLGISTWRVSAAKCKDAAYNGTTISTSSTYTLNCPYLDLINITCSPKVDYEWSISKVAALGDLVVSSNILPHLWEVTTAGTFGTTEATWNLSGTTTQGSAVLTYVAPLVTPITLGPRKPS